MLPHSVASFLHLIVSMSTRQLKGIVLFWCLSALYCHVSSASALTVPLNWQLTYKSVSSEDGNRHYCSTKYERRNQKHIFVLLVLAAIAEFFNQIEVYSMIVSPKFCIFHFPLQGHSWLKLYWVEKETNISWSNTVN